MRRLGQLGRKNPFHRYICDSCGKELAVHWVYSPDKLGDVIPNADGRKPDGRYYCNRDGLGWAKSYHQRELRRTMEAGYRAEAI